MAKLINGNGNKAIRAAQDADLIAALAGNVTGIAKVGNKFAATQEDANTIGISDGVIVTKEGRRIQLDVGSVDLFDIPTGTAGVTSYYIIGYHLITNSDSSQTCETFVQKMDNATDVITENTFRGGATEVYVSCYRVVQDGLNIDSINALLPELENISTLMSALPNNSGDIDYTATTGQTYSQVLDHLFSLINASKITPNSKLIVGADIYSITYIAVSLDVFRFVQAVQANVTKAAEIKSSASTMYNSTNDVSSVAVTGINFKIIYN